MVQQPRRYSVLVVDDDFNLLSLLSDLFFSRGYTVFTAMNGKEALAIVQREKPDMVISDIQMPVMNGFELFSALEREYPRIKKVMMTGCDIDEYLSLIRAYNIGNILMKGGDFHLGEISQYIHMLLTGDIFGLEKSFSTDAIQTCFIHNNRDASTACDTILKDYWGSDKVMLEIAINELISNAVFHGVLQMSNIPRTAWSDSYSIENGLPVKVCWAMDPDRIGVSVEDPKGNLKKADVLRWLDHPITEVMEGEEHGRGLMLIRRIIDRFIINIESGKRTECILFHYRNRDLAGKNNKPLIVHEI
jgi:CheY-like chemotaxis protein